MSDVKHTAEIAWNGPLEVIRGLRLPVRLWADDGDCKWLQVGHGRYMFNNDGTQVEGATHVHNPADYRALASGETP